MKKPVLYLGIGLTILGVFYAGLANQISNLWITGTGLTLVALSLLIDRLTYDWQKKFAEIEGKFSGTTDAVRGCYADIEAIKKDVLTLSPDTIEELELRVENLEAGEKVRSAMGQVFVETYKPPAPRKVRPD